MYETARASQAIPAQRRPDGAGLPGPAGRGLVAGLLPSLRAFAIPMRTRFRGITVREGALIEGPAGWGEFSPFPEYGPRECARWLGLRAGGRHVRLAAPGPRRGAGERDRARGRPGAGTRHRGRVRLPHRQGEGGRARPVAAADRPGWRRSGTRSAATGGSGSMPTAPGTWTRRSAPCVSSAGSGWNTPSSPAPPWPSWPSCGGGWTCRWRRMSPSAGPRTRWPCGRPAPPTSWCSRCSRWAGYGPRWGGGGLRTAGGRFQRGRDLGRAGGRGGAGRRAARAPLCLRPGHDEPAHRRRDRLAAEGGGRDPAGRAARG